ncbi:Hypothetical protein SRAE_2000271400 [Strongyloides ratti]|uniref:Uncharacterized protein n=1 Tax=Strongyloides ratti TaxID=34506 RepID=A0A090MYZ7_STRRB|nr:Hypothetical protein SRAE_2000271400 [Strongyloides ratti]CEF68054.1 Hypothetical protein SRAE_2000271400 [Strongyloides ratti]
MADSIQDDDEMNMENHMEKIRLAVSSYEIDQFSNKLQRNMMERRQHFDVKDRINIKNTIDFMKRNIPIDETLPLDRKLHAFATANNFEIKYNENEIYLSSSDFIMSITCQNEIVEKVTITWFRCQGTGMMEGTNIKKLINENKFRILSQKLKIYSRTIDSSFKIDEKEKIFNVLLQEDEEYSNLSSSDSNSGPIGKFFKRTDLEPSFFSIFCDRLLLFQQNSINDHTFKCYINIISEDTHPIFIEGTNIKYAYMLRFSKPLLIFEGFAKELMARSCRDVLGSLKADIFTQILGITKRKKNLVTNEKFQPTVKYLVGDELIYRNKDFVIEGVSFTNRNNLIFVVEIVRVQLFINHLIESIKRDTFLEQFVSSKSTHDVLLSQPRHNTLEFTLYTPNGMKLLLQIKVVTMKDILVDGYFANGDILGSDIVSVFLNVLVESWSIPLSILALMKKLGFDSKYNCNINCLKKQSSSELSKVGNAWHYFLKFTKKWRKKKLKKKKYNISNLFIDNPVLLNGKAVDILGTLVPIQSDIDMTYFKPKQTFYSPYPPNVNNGQRILFNKNIQKQNIVVDILPNKPKSDLEAMAEIGQNLSKDNSNSSQRGVVTKYSDNVIKTPTVIGKYPVQNDNSQFVSPLNSGNVQSYQQNLSVKNIVPSSSVNSSNQNVTHTKHKKSKNKKSDFTEGVFKVPNINILPTSSVTQQSFSDETEVKKNKKDPASKKSKKVKKNILSETLASVTHQQDSLKVTFSRLPLESHSNKVVDDASLSTIMKPSPTFSKSDFKIKHENVPDEKIITVEKNKDLLETGKAKNKLKKMLENSNQSVKGKLSKSSNDIICEVEIDKPIKQEAVISSPTISMPTTTGTSEPPVNSELKIKIKRPKITIKNLEPPKPREIPEIKEIKEEAITKIVDLPSSSPKVKEQTIRKGGVILSKSKSTNDAREKKSNKRKANDHTPSPRSKSSKKEKLDLNPPSLVEQAPADTFNAIGKKNAFDLLKNFRIPKLEGKEEKPVEKPIDKNEKIDKVEKIEKVKDKPDKNKDVKFKERHKERDREREREKERDRCRDKYNKERESSKRRSLSPANRENYTPSIKTSNEKTTTTTSTADITKLVGFIPLAAIKPSTHTSLSQNRHSSRSHSNSSDHYRTGNYSSHSRKSSVNDNHHSSSRSHHNSSSSSSHNHRSSSKSSILSKSPLTSPTSTSSGSKWVKMSQPVQQPYQIQTKIIDQRMRNEQQGKQVLFTREPSPCDLTIDESDN